MGGGGSEQYDVEVARIVEFQLRWNGLGIAMAFDYEANLDVIHRTDALADL